MGESGAFDGIALLLIRLAANTRVIIPVTYIWGRRREYRSSSSCSFSQGSCSSKNCRISLSQGALNRLLGSLASPRAFEALDFIGDENWIMLAVGFGVGVRISCIGRG